MTSDGSLQGLRQRFAGDLVSPDDDDYPDARRVWNGAINRYPRVVARCTGPADVAHAVSFAADADLPVAVRGGGHGVSGGAVVDDGVVIDLGWMDDVRVDPDEQVARVSAGARWGDVDRETQAHGLATPGGVVSDTGVAGLTLGGGFGHLRRTFGLSCDNVRSMDVVTAEGDLVVASADRNPDLFWALRGGGGNFGVVTSFEFDLHPVGPEVATCFVWYDGDEATEVLHAFREWADDAPREANALPFYAYVPAVELFPEDAWDDPAVAVLGAWAGDPDEGVDELRDLRTLADPLADFSDVLPYREFQRLLDEDYPEGRLYYWKSVALAELTDDVVDLLVERGAAAPSTLSTVDLWHLGGAIREGDGAFPKRDAAYLFNVEANWDDPRQTEANVQWVRDTVDAVRELDAAEGMYVNFAGFGEDAARVAYGESYDRLREVNERYDPEGVFSGHTPIHSRD
ncbi:FAD-binding oxidoreductase [Halobacterium wangiae]|uniref:FAD-binding oxidoreductase n=1 Tax=Halobacterium wangiae TaxID=2902623 RepID=UPI001E395848|nr:FAD-binding oxidoreductase [Halobacterium wangiae]